MKLALVGCAVVLTVAGAWLALACLANAQSRAKAEAEPWEALAWDSGNTHARTRLAEVFSERHTVAQDTTTATTLAREALSTAPLDGAALRVLGIEAQRTGDMSAATRLMAASDRVTQRDSTAQLWLLDQAIRQGRYEAAYAKAETALRASPAQAGLVFQVMRIGLEDPRSLRPLMQRLVQRPPWRNAFVAEVFASGESARDAKRLFAALTKSRAPPSETETKAMIDRLVADGAYADAYVLWRGLSHVAHGDPVGVFAGDFLARPGAPPFNWRLTESGEAFAALSQAPDGGPALQAQFGTRENADLAEQLLVLPPGSYRLSGAAQVATGGLPGQVGWSVTCAGAAGRKLTDLRQGDAPANAWLGFQGEFDVPTEGCSAQWLRLRSFAQDRFATTSAWYRNLSIVPIAPNASQEGVTSAAKAPL